MEEKNKTIIKDEELASRWARLGAILIDSLLAMAITIPVMIYFGLFGDPDQASLPFSVTLKLAVFGLLLFFVMHGYLLSKYGQTIGKRLLKIKIVDISGNKLHFKPLIAKRYFPLWIATLVPLIGQFIAVIDALFIFRKDKRCLHDLIASTKVVNSK